MGKNSDTTIFKIKLIGGIAISNRIHRIIKNNRKQSVLQENQLLNNNN